MQKLIKKKYLVGMDLRNDKFYREVCPIVRATYEYNQAKFDRLYGDVVNGLIISTLGGLVMGHMAPETWAESAQVALEYGTCLLLSIITVASPLIRNEGTWSNYKKSYDACVAELQRIRMDKYLEMSKPSGGMELA